MKAVDLDLISSPFKPKTYKVSKGESVKLRRSPCVLDIWQIGSKTEGSLDYLQAEITCQIKM